MDNDSNEELVWEAWGSVVAPQSGSEVSLTLRCS